MRPSQLIILPLIILMATAGCWGKPQASSDASDSGTAPAAKKEESLDPISTPIYAGERAKAKVIKAAVGSSIRGFQEAEGRNPASIQELVDKQYLRTVPKTPVGYRFEYNPETGEFDVVEK